ncbi:sensor histidine kinase [Micromonospora sp. NPDC047670]|uniref:sensor histidine kinase n=1 Tax=Micromonospora sp. NPDC047670 TaxID=3364252 RepID=UPI003718F0D3
MRGRHGFQGPRRGLRRAGPGPDAGDPALADADPDLLLRVLCHEFRTPVATLTSLTRALADDRSPLTGDDRRAVTALAHDQAVHLADLLRVAVAGSSALAPATRPAEPAAPLAEILRAAAVLVPRHRRRIRVTRRAGGCPVPERRTRQVLTNLVENALRHGPPEGQVGIHAALRGSGLSILVVDEGRVDAALVEALRRPAPAPGVSGLGLWIVRRLLAADGGRLHLHRLRPRGVALEAVFPRAAPTG